MYNKEMGAERRTIGVACAVDAVVAIINVKSYGNCQQLYGGDRSATWPDYYRLTPCGFI
jgi:hypothetical protein